MSAKDLPRYMDKTKQELLRAGRSEKQADEGVQFLAQQAMRKKQLAEADARKEKKIDTASAERLWFIREHKLEAIARQVNELSDLMFERLAELCELGGNARRILGGDPLRRKRYEALRKVLESRGKDELMANSYRQLTAE